MSGELTHSVFPPASFFTQCGRHFSFHGMNRNADIPFKDHAQFPMLTDIVSRKNTHHVILQWDVSPQFYPLFVEAALQHFHQQSSPLPLQQTECIYLNTDNLILNKAAQQTLEKEFDQLRETLNAAQTYLFFAFSDTRLLTRKSRSNEDNFLRAQFMQLSIHPKCRLIFFTRQKKYFLPARLDGQFELLSLHTLLESDVIKLLRQQRCELENFHHVLLPEELLMTAYSLTDRYLSSSNTLEKTLLLLDSCAARTHATEKTDSHTAFKPVVTPDTLLQVLSSWTQLPASHLPLNKFKFSEFTQGMQQRLFGQDAAITVMGRQLQQAYASLRQHTGPFCSLLLAGPENTGKKAAALALTEQLFKQLNLFYIAETDCLPPAALTDITLKRHTDQQYFLLKDVIRQTPCAVILFENAEQLPSGLLHGLQEILSTGYLHDASGQAFSFRQSTLLLTTALGATRLSELAKLMLPEKETRDINLMHLVMNEHKPSMHNIANEQGPQEWIDAIAPEIHAVLPASLCEHLPIVPFLPLNKTAIDRIFRLKLKQLGKILESRHGIELGYAPEVIRYLVNEAMLKKEGEKICIEKSLKPLYFIIEQAILNQTDHHNPSRQLFLQLNETGQLLKCDWLAAAAMRHHSQ